MKILKKNQIIISVIALMLITAGYMNYSSNISQSLETGALLDSEQVAGIGDARLVNSNEIVENNDTSVGQEQQNELESNATNETAASSTNDVVENKTESTETSSASYDGNYFASSRLERNTMYSEMLETYEGILENTNISSEQKGVSSQEITNINNKKNSIMIAENLIKNLGFDDVVIFVNDTSVSVIVHAETLQEADVAQIQNIVCRELGVSAELIHISVK